MCLKPTLFIPYLTILHVIGNVSQENNRVGCHEAFASTAKYDGFNYTRSQWLSLLYFNTQYHSSRFIPVVIYDSQYLDQHLLNRVKLTQHRYTSHFKESAKENSLSLFRGDRPLFKWLFPVNHHMLLLHTEYQDLC